MRQRCWRALHPARRKASAIHAGGHQESGKRAGTENVPGIVALAAPASCTEHIKKMTNVARLTAWNRA